MGVRRQGLEPRTVALRVLVRRILDLQGSARKGSDLGACIPLLSVVDPCSPLVRGPSAAQEGTAYQLPRPLPYQGPPGGRGDLRPMVESAH